MTDKMENLETKKQSDGFVSRLIKTAITLVIIIFAGIISFRLWYYDFRPYVSTEDARINADIVRVANLGAGGQIQEVYVKEGDMVTQGMLLLELDHGIAQAQYEKAESRSDYTGAVFQRDKELLENSGLTKQQFEAARFDYNTSQADLKLAKIALNRTFLKSPADGTVILKNAIAGNTLEAGQTAFMIADIKNAWVSANISEKSIDLVKPGQEVFIIIDQFGGVKFKGRVRSIGKAANSIFSLLPASSGSTFTKVIQLIQVKIDLIDKSIALIPGENVDVKIRVK